MKKYIKKVFLILLLSIVWWGNPAFAAETKSEIVSTKKERNHITKGNKFFEEGKFKDAMHQYEEALEDNPESVVGKYNLGLSQIRIGSNPNDTSETAKKYLETGIKNMEQVANLGTKRADLASKANYNLGNIAFGTEDYQKAVDYYKRSLRLNPEDENARRNLRIAQLKIENQDNQNNQDQQQEQDQQQDQDNRDNQDQQQDNNQDRQQQDQDQQQDNNQQQSNLNQQTAEQILSAIENKENQTRARVAGQNAEKSRNKNRNKRNW